MGQLADETRGSMPANFANHKLKFKKLKLLNFVEILSLVSCKVTAAVVSQNVTMVEVLFT